MGAALTSIMNALSCKDLYKYVLNDMSCESECCLGNCECETHAVEDSSREDDYEANTCCGDFTYIKGKTKQE